MVAAVRRLHDVPLRVELAAPMRLALSLLLLLAMTPEAGQGFLGIGLEQGDGCVTALLVDPEGPATQAGLRERDCVSRVGAEKVSRIEEMLAAIAASKPGLATTLSLTDGRTLTVVPVPRSTTVESRFCRYRAQVRPHIQVVLLERDGSRVSLDGVFAIRDLRNRFDAKEHARIIFGSSCSDAPHEFRMELQPGEEFRVPDDAQVQFGYDAPGPRQYISLEDGGIIAGSCLQADGGEVIWKPDAGQPCPVLTVPAE